MLIRTCSYCRLYALVWYGMVYRICCSVESLKNCVYDTNEDNEDVLIFSIFMYCLWYQGNLFYFSLMLHSNSLH